jgi:hypothetical protein
MGNGTAKGLIEYLDNLIARGKGSPGAINPLKIAFTKVMKTVDGNNWQSVSVRGIDVDSYMDRFTNLTLGKYSSESLVAYKTRVGKVIGWYTRFLDTPGWEPSIQRRAPRQNKDTDLITTPTPTEAPTSNPEAVQQPQPATPPASSLPDFITYPYPLSNGQLVQISLPLKLSKTDAKRIGAFIESIAIES